MYHAYAVIMAGGSGTRLWPVSRRSHPKHTLPLLGKDTLFQSTVARLDGLLPRGHILVVTTASQAGELRQQVPDIPEANFLLEPEPRGTASVVGFAASILQKRDPQAVMCILPSDHYIRNQDLFHLILNVAMDVAQKGYLVTLGITPTYPATGYGYIQRGELLPQQFPYPVYRVLKFKEKPEEAQAREMILRGDHSWNSGMFIWQVDSILNEIQKQMPGLKEGLDSISAAWETPHRNEILQAIWPRLHTETIDYGIMENAGNVAVLPASGLGWSDVGSWDSLFDVFYPDEEGNIVFGGDLLPLETHNSLVYGSDDHKLIVTVGVDDLVIVNTKDVLLVCHRAHTQQVRQVVAMLKDSENNRYL